jgi:glutamate-1-semialdehyde 2,1-aminomutase
MTLTLPASACELTFDPSRHTAASSTWFDRAKAALAGGISSSARATTTVAQAYPLYMRRGSGGRIEDVDGNVFVDFLLSYGALILGHANSVLVQTATEQLQRGTMFGTANTAEVELAECIQRMVPCADLVRFANSGSEAICGAVRAARGFTGKNKLLKFEGHYHGWVDILAVSNRPTLAESGPKNCPNSVAHSRGIPGGVVEDVVICPWNDPTTLRSVLDAHAGEFAAVIAEPIVANNACAMPGPGYLELLRDECTRRGILLIFDEIVTGFRLAAGGAQKMFGVTPDIAVFSKALGGGFPISAFAGTRKVMEPIGANLVKHGGTYNGNSLCAAAALAVLRRVERPEALQQIRRHGERVIEAIRRASRDHAIPCCVQGDGTMFQVVFSADGLPRKNYRELLTADARRYTRFRDGLLCRGLHVTPSGSACWFLCTEHDDDDIALACEAIDAAFADLK